MLPGQARAVRVSQPEQMLHHLGVLEGLLLDLVDGLEIDLFLRGGDKRDGHTKCE